ncbi:hypothetical protein [Agitococcus lubricus]|uniref:Uncharacterized protein n=1 Tax=Agitococcus lubricus TaxID=1077255 RepID=A0A2T5IRT8_9GAMM|nr:hypothetical protein [Agitococcus lubricus]PTQ86531.1 hypothetical protein C8N29_1424 [Agitococcus lubricus]
MNLYTIEAELNYHDLPVNLKVGWSSAFGAAFLDYVGENQIVKHPVSINGRLTNKCIFIGDEALAHQFAEYLQNNADKKKRSLKFLIRKVDSRDLDYRRKKAQTEANANDAKIRETLALFSNE